VNRAFAPALTRLLYIEGNYMLGDDPQLGRHGQSACFKVGHGGATVYLTGNECHGLPPITSVSSRGTSDGGQTGSGQPTGGETGSGSEANTGTQTSTGESSAGSPTRGATDAGTAQDSVASEPQSGESSSSGSTTQTAPMESTFATVCVGGGRGRASPCGGGR